MLDPATDIGLDLLLFELLLQLPDEILDELLAVFPAFFQQIGNTFKS